jgi:hypothetical protein
MRKINTVKMEFTTIGLKEKTQTIKMIKHIN